MHRSNAVLFILALALAAAACGAPPANRVGSPADTSASAPPPPGKRGHVNVNVVCGDSAHSPVFAIAPWGVRPDERRAVTWYVHGPGPDSIQVYAADPTHWPFTDSSFVSGERRQLAAIVDSTAAEGTYHYVLRLFCPDKVITIDPDIMLSEGN
jgi:hypothetical protein